MKGQSSGWNVITIAAIGIVVLFILIFLVINSSGNFSRGADSCEAKGGVCARECSFDEGFAAVPLNCPDDIPKCCIPQREIMSPDAIDNKIVVRD